ncbi:MAG TPA: tRNA lysidine(34) synthetase TilS [Desulfuromonadaceae bacterium]
MRGVAVDLADRVARAIQRHHLFRPRDTVIVGLSGGADSTALLELLSALPDHPVRLVAAHLNHCLRGPDADADEAFCRALALRHGIPFESRRIDVAELADQQGLNLEDAGRRSRIAFFDELAAKWQATAVALGHHADDQAETVLMRLLRGAGPDGLAGMPWRNGRGYIRPLLGVSRAEIEAWLTARGIGWREDASNRDTAFLRNRIRHELLPLLEQYTPAIRERLTTTAGLLADENALLEQLAETTFARACSRDGDAWSCDIGMLAEQPAAMRRRVLRLMLERCAGSLDHVARQHIADLELLLDSPRPNATLNLPQGLTAVREYGVLRLLRRPSPAPLPYVLDIPGPGTYPLPDGGALSVSLEPAPHAMAPLPRHIACFDAAKAPFPWQVRTFRAGDRMVPLGMDGSKKVKDIFIDLKIPLPQRSRIPLLFSGDTLIWVCGLRSSELARVDDGSARIAKAVISPA